MKIHKEMRVLVIVTSLLCIASFIIPFWVKSSADSIVSVLSLSFSAIGGITTAATFVIAILLYDKFGIERKFIDKQTETVLELVNALKGREFYAIHKGYNYVLRPSVLRLKALDGISHYNTIVNKPILMSREDYDKFDNSISYLRRSYWMPDAIKNKMLFLEIFGSYKTDKSVSDFVCLAFNSKHDENWHAIIPETTLGQFAENLVALVNEIEVWLSQHSSVPLDLRMEERA